MSPVSGLLEAIRRRGISIWLDGDNLVIRGQRSLTRRMREEIRRQKPAIIAKLTEDRRPGVALTPDLVAKFGKLDDHSKDILLNFSAHFPGASIEWAPRPKDSPEEPER